MKVLMVGLGAVGQRHLRNLRALLGDSLEVSAYRTRRLSRVLTDTLQVEADGDLEQKYGLQVYDALEPALAAKPEAVFVCNPTSLHLPVAIAAARAGCALFIEKPLSNQADGVSALVDLVERQHLVALVGYQMRFHPALRQVHAILEQRCLGQIVAVRAEVGEFLPAWHGYEDYRDTYGARADLGGGALVTQIHEFDYLYWLFGRPTRLYTVGGHLSHLQIDVEDVASTLMVCRDGEASFPIHLQQDYVQKPPSRTLQVIGDRGKLVLDLRELTLRVYDADGQVEEHGYANLQRNQLFMDELSHFLACLRGEAAPVVSVRTGAESLRIALAARRSMQTGQAIDLASDDTRLAVKNA